MEEPPAGTPGIPTDELQGDVGKPAVDVLLDIQDVFLQKEPLVAGCSWNDPIDRRQLRIRFSTGIDADWSRLDVTWYTSGAYTFHYTDENECNWRFDRHPNDHSPAKHFHEPPEANSRSAVQSCIRVEEPGLVARAVWKLWRRGVHSGSFAAINTGTNPP